MESLERDTEHGTRAICILSAVYGIRVSEIAHMEIKYGVVQVTTLKQNAKNMENPNIAINYGRIARKTITKKFTIKKINNQIIRIYHTFLNN